MCGIMSVGDIVSSIICAKLVMEIHGDVRKKTWFCAIIHGRDRRSSIRNHGAYFPGILVIFGRIGDVVRSNILRAISLGYNASK